MKVKTLNENFIIEQLWMRVESFYNLVRQLKIRLKSFYDPPLTWKLRTNLYKISGKNSSDKIVRYG